MKIYVSIQCIQEEKMLCIWYGMHIIHCCIQRSCDIVPNEIETVVDKFKTLCACVCVCFLLVYKHRKLPFLYCADSKNKYKTFIMAFLIRMINNKITHLKQQSAVINIGITMFYFCVTFFIIDSQAWSLFIFNDFSKWLKFKYSNMSEFNLNCTADLSDLNSSHFN